MNYTPYPPLPPIGGTGKSGPVSDQRRPSHLQYLRPVMMGPGETFGPGIRIEVHRYETWPGADLAQNIKALLESRRDAVLQLAQASVEWGTADVDWRAIALVLADILREDRTDAAQARMELEKHREHDGCITWQTNCESCARAWDSNYESYCREQQAEEKLSLIDARIGPWMSAALDDPAVCAEMKADINAMFAVLPR